MLLVYWVSGNSFIIQPFWSATQLVAQACLELTVTPYLRLPRAEITGTPFMFSIIFLSVWWRTRVPAVLNLLVRLKSIYNQVETRLMSLTLTLLLLQASYAKYFHVDYMLT